MGPTRTSPAPAVSAVASDAAEGRLLGDLARGDTRWTVYLETRPHPKGVGTRQNTVQGRLHFVDGSRRKSTGWIFVEWSDQDVTSRFGEFSAAELWMLLDSIA